MDFHSLSPGQFLAASAGALAQSPARPNIAFILMEDLLPRYTHGAMEVHPLNRACRHG